MVNLYINITNTHWLDQYYKHNIIIYSRNSLLLKPWSWPYNQRVIVIHKTTRTQETKFWVLTNVLRSIGQNDIFMYVLGFKVSQLTYPPQNDNKAKRRWESQIIPPPPPPPVIKGLRNDKIQLACRKYGRVPFRYGQSLDIIRYRNVVTWNIEQPLNRHTISRPHGRLWQF